MSEEVEVGEAAVLHAGDSSADSVAFSLIISPKTASEAEAFPARRAP